MSKKGGYRIVDLNYVDLLSDDLKIPGLYAELSKLSEKVILVSGITINSGIFPNVFTEVKNHSFELYGYMVSASQDDSITCEEISVDIPVATQSENGLMSAADKTKLDSITSELYHEDLLGWLHYGGQETVLNISAATLNLYDIIIIVKGSDETDTGLTQYRTFVTTVTMLKNTEGSSPGINDSDFTVDIDNGNATITALSIEDVGIMVYGIRIGFGEV